MSVLPAGTATADIVWQNRQLHTSDKPLEATQTAQPALPVLRRNIPFASKLTAVSC